MAGGPTQMTAAQAQTRWGAHPLVASSVRVTIFVLPIVVSILFGIWASNAIPPGRLGVNPWIWWLGLLVAASGLVRILELVLRRLAPLGMLFKLSLVFPDQTPGRFKSALRTGNTAATKRRIAEIQAGGGALAGDDAVSAQMLDLITMLSKHDRMTRGHAERVRGYTELIAEEMGIGGGSLERLRWAALLHDMGKLEVPAEILNKDGRPSDEEWEILKQHPAAAERHLEPVSEWLGEWRHAADGHHEKWDGSGYPRGLAGNDIPLAARIVAVADAYDVMTSTRSYKKPLPAEVARSEISGNAGTQFDPMVARAFLSLSLGDLRRVGGPVAWFASLPAVRQVPIGSVAQPVATGFAATATAVSAAVAGVPTTPPEPPPAVAFADEEMPSLPAPEQTVVIVPPATPEPAEPAAVPVATPANLAPQMESQTISVPEDSAPGIVGSLAAADPDGPEALRWALLDDDLPFAVSASGDVSVNPNAVLDAETRTAFDIEVAVTDGMATTTTTHTIVITDVDESPEATDLRTFASESAANGDVLGEVTATDPEDDQLTFELLRQEQVPFAVGRTGGQLIVVGALDYEAAPSYTLSVIVTDDGGNTDIAVIEVLVANVDEAPNNARFAATVNEGSTVVIDLTDRHVDPEGTAVELSSLSDPGSNGAAVVVDATTLTYTHNGNNSAEDTIGYVVTDASGLEASGLIDVTITPVNDAPLATDQTFSILETASPGATVGSIVASDPDGDDLEFRTTVNATPFAVSIDGVVTVEQALNHEANASHTLDVVVTDSVGAETPIQVRVATLDVNDPPVLGDQTATVAEDSAAGPTGFVLAATDADGPNPLNRSLQAGSPFSMTSAGELVLDDPAALNHEANPTYTLEVLADDGEITTTAFLTIIISDVNERPNALDQTYEASETDVGGTALGTFTATDPENDTLSVSIAPGTNPNLDGDAMHAFSVSITGTTVTVAINDADDVQHGIAGQATTLGVVLDDGNGNTHTVNVSISTLSRFGLSPHFGEIIINEVDWSSTGAEFIELLNVSGGQVNIANWTISDYAFGVDPADASSVVGTLPSTATAFDNGQRVLFWPHTSPDAQVAGIEFEGNQGLNRLRRSDDVWLLDENGRIVAYMAWGTDAVQDGDNEIGGRPPITSWGLWDTAHEADLGSGPAVNQGQSIAVAIENAASSQSSACWEASTTGDAGARCAGANLTQDLVAGNEDNGAPRVSSPGRPNY